MATGLRVGPVHRAGSSDEALRLAREWLSEHRPADGPIGVGGYVNHPYTVHVKPSTRHPGQWEARAEATWTPTPQRRSA